MNNETKVIYNIHHYQPASFAECILPAKLKTNISTIIQSAKKQNRLPNHILMYGRPGVGKTTLAKVITKELGVPLIMFNGSELKDAKQLDILMNVEEPGAVVFIDEIHAIRVGLLEFLYPIMEECQFTISPTTKIYLAPLTFIGATTEIGIVPKPIVDRFSYLIDMPTYSIEELRLITNNMAKSSGIDIDEPAAKLIATICKNSPRIIRNILGICVDITVVKDKTKITEDIVREYMHNYGVLNDEGLTETDLKVLKVLNTSGSIGKESIISMTQINKEEYRYIIEPFLLEKGYMTLTKSGRVISDKGKTLFA